MGIVLKLLLLFVMDDYFSVSYHVSRMLRKEHLVMMFLSMFFLFLHTHPGELIVKNSVKECSVKTGID